MLKKRNDDRLVGKNRSKSLKRRKERKTCRKRQKLPVIEMIL